jgi:hypothetical protein
MSATRSQAKRLKYGYSWDAGVSDADVERWMIRDGGRHWNEKTKHFHGESLLEHYKRLAVLLWPDEEVDPWTELAFKSWVEHKITVLMACKDAAKTSAMAKICLMDWWCYPDTTLWLISSTTKQGAELRVWGRIKEYYNRAKQAHPYLEGRCLISLGCITTQQVDAKRNQELARILQRGIVLVPCKGGSDYVGLSAYQGIKAPRLRHGGDEAAAMTPAFLNAYNNFVGEEKGFKGIMAGNPTDLLDPLCRAAKPVGGWDNFVDNKKTQEWESEFFGAHVICFDGRDTPNNKFPYPPARYKHLITPRDVENIIRTNGPESPMAYMFAYGKPNRILTSKRVITEMLCRQHKALEDVLWRGGGRTWIYGLDPAYGGTDPCVGMPGEFGEDVDGKTILKLYPPEIVPIRAGFGESKDVDDQIAEWIKERLLQLNVPSINCFYGAFGKGTLGNAFAKVFGTRCPIPIDEGGLPTKRPVRDDEFVTDRHSGERRLKRADEHYDRKISELWYSARLVIESDQMRGLTQETMDQGCMRIYEMAAGAKVSVETKDKLKKRMQGESPNFFDCATFIVEGARQRGFKIDRLSEKAAVDDGFGVEEAQEEYDNAFKTLTFA